MEGTALSTGGWLWIPWDGKAIRLHQESDRGVRTIAFPKWHGSHGSLAPSPDGTKLLLVGARMDTIRVSVMSVENGATTLIKSMLSQGAAFAVWLADGSIILSVWRRPDSGLTIYRLSQSGATLWTVTVPHPVWSISFSADMKRAAVTVREYRGDASVSRVLRN